MIPAISIIIMWIILGIYAIFMENKNDSQIALIIFISLIPLFPFIFKACGVI